MLLFKSRIAPWQRAVAALSVLLMLGVLAGCKVDLQSRLAEEDANELVDVLYAEEIGAAKVREDEGLWTVRVEEAELQRAIRTMRSHGLPRQSFTSMGDLFKKEGMISSPSEERIRYVYAVSQELSRTLSQIDGVTAARVHPVIPFNDPLAERVKPSSVSVFIKHRREANLQVLGPAIKNLVLRSIEGLRDDSISLTFIPSAAVTPAPPPVDKPQAGWQNTLIGVLGVLLAATASALAYLGMRKRPGGGVAFAGRREARREPRGDADGESARGSKAWWSLRFGRAAAPSRPRVVGEPG